MTPAPSGFTTSIIGSTSFFQGLLASPPPIGSTTPNSGAFTTLTTTGNVGVGTSSPNAKIDLGSSTGLNGIYVYDDGTGASGLGISTNTLNVFSAGTTIAFGTGYTLLSGYTPAMMLKSGGLGINQDPTNWYTFTPLIVASKTQNADSSIGIGNPTIGTSASATYKIIGGTANSYLNLSLVDNNGSPYLVNDLGSGVTYAKWGFGGAERMRITAAGNVGIGTTSPGYLLTVNGTGSFTGTLLANGGTVLSSVTNPANNPITGTPSSSTYLRGDGTWVTSLSNAVTTATGSTTSRTLAARAADFVNLEDFGAVGDGVTDDTVSVNAWIAEVLSTGNVGYAPAGNYKVTSPILIDYVSVATTGFTLMGAGVQRTVFTSTVTTGAAFQLYCSGGTVPSPKIGVYPKITQLAFYANTVGPTLRIGNYDFSDQQNLVRLEIWCSNSSNDSSARCIEMNSCYGCYIQYNGGLGATNPPSYTLSAAGINLSLRQSSFSQFFISMGSTANNTTGAILGTATGVWFSDGFSYGNVFTTPDFEIFDVAVRITSANAVRNTFVGGEWAYKSYGVVATTGSDNVFINPNINATTPFFQSGVNAVGVSRVDATSLFDYQLAAPAPGDTVTSGTVRTLRLTQGGTLASLTILLPPSPFDGQMFDIFTTYAIAALTLTPTPFDTITTLPASSKVSFLFNAGGNQWIRVG